MSANRNFTDQDYELLSAYLDGALPESERAALETRLLADDALRHELEAMRQTVNLLKGLPTLKAPRNFTLTRDMVRGRSERWFIFPTSAAFSAVTAAAATILILFGAGMLLLQNNATLTAPPDALFAVQQGQSEVALQPTQAVQTADKTAEDDALIRLTATALGNLLSSPMTPSPAPTLMDGFALPESVSAPPGEGAGGAIVPGQPLSTSDGFSDFGLTTDATLDEEQADQILQFAPFEATQLAGATMAMASPPLPAAADSATQSGAAAEPDLNTQSNAAGETMADQGQLPLTATPDASLSRDRSEELTATAAGLDQAAVMAVTDTPSPNPTTVPTATATATASATPAPTGTVTATPPPPPPSQATSPDAITWAVLALGIGLLIVAGVTTFIRWRNR